MYSENSSSARFRALFASPILLTAIIAYTTQIVMSLLQSIFAKSVIASVLSRALGSAVSASELRTVMSLFSGGFGISTVLGMIPTIFVCVSLWLVFAGAKKNDGSYPIMNPIGFKLLNVYNIICMVLMILSTVLIVIGAVISLFGIGSLMSNVKGSGGAMAAMIIGMLIALIFPALAIIFYNKAHKLARQLADAASTGNVQVEMGSFVTVILWIVGVLIALAVVPSFLGGVFAILNSIAGAVTVICFAIFLGKLRSGLAAIANAPADSSYDIPMAPPSASPAYDAPDFGRTSIPESVPAPAPQLAPTAPLSHAILLRQKTGENIQVNSQSFTLGRNPSIANYVISDNSKVSGNHASILTMNGAYYLVDNNSTNHTYLNGSMIQPGTKVPLKNQSVIKLYNEVFIFIIP